MKFRKRVWAAAVVASCMSVPGALAQVSDNVVRIGILNDQSGPYIDLAGPGSVLAAEMAAEDFGGTVLGATIDIVSADHQNKPDVGSAIARRWFDEGKVDAIADVPTSSVALAVQEIVRNQKKVFLISGAASEALTDAACSPYSVQTSDDTYALTHGTVKAAVEAGADTWFFITADYTFGHTIEQAGREIVEAAGGKVLGAVRHPQNTADFAQFLLQAQTSGAKAIGLANAGADTVNAVKQAAEFGITQAGQQLVGMILFISEINALGLQDAQGLLLTEGFYWNMNDEAREFSRRFSERFGKVPTREHAMTYATVLHYLKSIEKAGTDESLPVVEAMKAMPMEVFGSQGTIREDGRLVHDLALWRVKAPSESTGSWDFYERVHVIDGETAFKPLSQSQCALITKK